MIYGAFGRGSLRRIVRMMERVLHCKQAQRYTMREALDGTSAALHARPARQDWAAFSGERV
jgi:hypothetical protein